MRTKYQWTNRTVDYSMWAPRWQFSQQGEIKFSKIWLVVGVGVVFSPLWHFVQIPAILSYEMSTCYWSTLDADPGVEIFSQNWRRDPAQHMNWPDPPNRSSPRSGEPHSHRFVICLVSSLLKDGESNLTVSRVWNVVEVGQMCTSLCVI